jgi:hypothetical protein
MLRPEKTKSIKTNTKRDTIGDPTYDLIRVFENKDIGQMSDEELELRITNLQKMRLMRFTTAKKTTSLDVILSKITVEKAREILAASELVETLTSGAENIGIDK